MDTEVIPHQPVSLWRNRDYLLLWLGHAVSSLGTSCTEFAFPLLIVVLTHSIAAAGLAYSLGQLPYVLLSLPAGALVDRWPRKRVMLLCTFCLMVCVASIPLALFLTSGQLRLLLLYALAFGLGAISLFYELAELAARAWVVPKSQLTTAVAQNELIVGSCSLLGPALGSWLFSITRLLPFVTDALSSLILLSSLLSIRSPMQDERRTERHHLLGEVREGLTWLWSQKVMRSIFLISSYVNFTITASVLLVLAIVQQQHIPSVLYGLIVAAGGVGNLLGTALCPPLQRHIRIGLALGCALIVFVLLWPLYGFITTPTAVGSRLRGHRSLRLDPCYLHGQLSLRCRPRCPARPRQWRLSPDLVQRPHHRLLRTRAEPRVSGRFAYRGHRVEWPASDNRIAVSLSAHAASDIPTRVNSTMLLLILRCGASLP